MYPWRDLDEAAGEIVVLCSASSEIMTIDRVRVSDGNLSSFPSAVPFDFVNFAELFPGRLNPMDGSLWLPTSEGFRVVDRGGAEHSSRATR